MGRVRCLIATTAGAARADEVAVAVDVLRASTTITVALEQGAAAVAPVREVEGAFELARARPGSLLMGERSNAIVPGFDLGNSPVALLGDRAANVRGRTIVFTSTNFPRAVGASAGARAVLVGCLANLSAVADAAAELAGREGRKSPGICIALAGNLDAADDEDLAFAGACGLRLAAAGFEPDESLRGPMEAVERLGAGRMVMEAPHAKALERQGYGNDVRFAARPDSCRAVGIVREGLIVAMQSSGGRGGGRPA